MIRLAALEDMAQILAIYASARVFMKNKGNPTQWGDTYPEVEMLLKDIALKQLYVMEENNAIVGCFVLAGGEDETYHVIENGKWRSHSPYGTIHRIASNGHVSGVFSKCFAFASTLFDHLRVDTHADNRPMQEAVLREGFIYAGIIFTYDGSERFAYDWLKNEKNN